MHDLVSTVPEASPSTTTQIVRRQLSILTQRFDERARRLEQQANAFLIIIIIVLLAGAAAFVFAAEIARFDLKTVPTAAEQYQQVDAALKEDLRSIAKLESEIKPLVDDTAAVSDVQTQLNGASANFSQFIEPILHDCQIVYRSYSPNPLDFDLGVLQSEKRKGQFYILIPGNTLYFSSQGSAESCAEKIRAQESTIKGHIKEIGGIIQILDQKKKAFSDMQSPKVESLKEERLRLSKEVTSLQKLKDALVEQATLEKIYGKALPKIASETAPLAAPNAPGTSPAKAANADSEASQANWPSIIQTNATRYGALAVAFFLVGILVPQYRYNVRMANFYRSRADLVVFLNKNLSRADFDQIITAVTPTIDFGKAPQTPIDQLMELAKALKK